MNGDGLVKTPSTRTRVAFFFFGQMNKVYRCIGEIIDR